MGSANIVVEIQFKFLNEGVLSTEEPCTCEYVTLLKTLSFKSLNWISATIFAELIRFGQDPKLRRLRTFWKENLVFHLKKISYFYFTYIFPLVLLSFNSFIYIFSN